MTSVVSGLCVLNLKLVKTCKSSYFSGLSFLFFFFLSNIYSLNGQGETKEVDFKSLSWLGDILGFTGNHKGKKKEYNKYNITLKYSKQDIGFCVHSYNVL